MDTGADPRCIRHIFFEPDPKSVGDQFGRETADHRRPFDIVADLVWAQPISGPCCVSASVWCEGGLCVCIPDFLSRLLVRRDPEIVRDGQETSFPLIGGDPGPGRKASKEAASKKNAAKEAASMEKASKEADSKNNASREAASKDTASKEAASKEAASVVGFGRPGLLP